MKALRRFSRAAGTVRFRITGLATLAVLIVLVATGIALLAAQRHVLTETVDEGITGNVDNIEERVVADDLPDILTALGEDDTVAQVVSADGEVTASSANLEGEPPIADPPPAGEPDHIRTVHDIPIDDAAFRLLSRQVDGPAGPVTIHVAATLDDIHESVAALTASLLVAIPTVVIMLALLVWWLVGRTLGPVEAIRAEVAGIGGSDLHRRVPVPPHDDEIGRLARTMNEMLGRVDHAARRQQRFVADASHELRSPLTRMRAALEVDLAHPESADTTATHHSVLEETVGLQHLVDDLLQLARSDAGTIPPGDREPVDLDDLVMRLTRRLRADGRVAVDVSGVTAAQVHGDPDQLLRAIGNVLDNAARHAASVVTVALDEQDDRAVLSISDDGPGIPVEHHQWVFERFTRLDDARSTATGGAGLGLAIARDIVQHHGGTIAIDPEHHPGARFVVTLPLEPVSGAAGPPPSHAGERVVDEPPGDGADDGADDADGSGRDGGVRPRAQPAGPRRRRPGSTR
jgi:signal transduction histidine kinase